MTVCCQNLTLRVFSIRALSILAGALFKKLYFFSFIWKRLIRSYNPQKPALSVLNLQQHQVCAIGETELTQNILNWHFMTDFTTCKDFVGRKSYISICVCKSAVQDTATHSSVPYWQRSTFHMPSNVLHTLRHQFQKEVRRSC